MKDDADQIHRVRRSKDAARRDYDRLSGWYDHLAGRSERGFRARCLERLAIGNGEVVLEIGFGTGEALLKLARSVGATGAVSGIDLSEGMTRVARAKLEAAGLSDRVRLHCGDATTLPYAAGTFDATFMSFTLELFDTPEIPIVLSECRRVLHPGGRLGVVAMSKRGGAVERVYEWLHKRFPVFIDCRPIDVECTVRSAGFEVASGESGTLWGLGVETLVARLPEC